MTNHPTDEDLILHFYGESRLDQTTRLEAHLAGCAECRAAWENLSDTMTLVDTAAIPEPPDGFERVMWAQVQAALPAPRAAASGWSWWRLAPVSGLLAAVMVLLAVSASAPPPSPMPADLAVAEDAARAFEVRERVLLTALDSHLEQSEMLLVELMNAPDVDEREIEFEQATADDLVASGRLYRVTAAEQGAMALVQMLEDLESVLVDVARGPSTVGRTEMASLRARIDGEDLLFKVRAATNEVRGRQQAMFAVSQ